MSKIKKALKLIYDNLRYAKYHIEQNKNYKKHKFYGNNIKIIFLVQRTEVWNSVKSIYEAACKAKNITVYLVAVPPMNKGILDLESTRSYEFCKQIDFHAINSYDSSKKKFIDLKELEPDYIFLNTPYNHEYPMPYKFENISKYAKICYASYGYMMIDSSINEVSHNPMLLRYSSFIFKENYFSYKYCRKKLMLEEFIDKRCVFNLGYPRFDLYRNLDKTSCNDLFNILWIPRWTVKDEDNEPSSFFDFKDKFLDYLDANQKIQGIIRPHPLAFNHYIESGKMTEKEVEKYKSRIVEQKNACLDTNPSYMESLLKADVLIADFSSLIMEFFITEKPIIYLGNTDCFIKELEQVYHSFYLAENWNQVERLLNELCRGNDSKKTERKKVVDNFFGNQNINAGERILEELKQDYKKWRGEKSFVRKY